MPIAPQITNTPVDITSADFAITAVSYTSSTATYTAAGHTFSAGDTVIVSGIVPAGYSGTFTVSSVVAGTSFTCANTTNAAVTTATGDAFSANATDFTYADVQQVYSADITDVNGVSAAAAAAQAAATAAASAATAAQTTADGKNTIYRQSSTPTGGTYKAGDLWFNTSLDNQISRYDGSSWISTLVGTNALANFSANKITSGTIDASVINVSNINAGNISTGYLAASRIATASLDASVLNAGTINSSVVYAGTINASQINAGTLTGFTIQTSAGASAVTLSGSTNSIDFKSSSSTVGHLVPLNIGGSTYGVIMHYGATADGSGGTYPQVYVGSSNASIYASSTVGIGVSTSLGTTVTGQLTVTGNLQVQSMSASAYTPVYWNSSNNRFYATTSSARYKDNIVTIPAADYLSAVLKLEPVTFTYKAEYTDDTSRVNFGLIAESVAQIPELDILVNKNNHCEPDSVLFDRLAVFLIPALKQLNDRVIKLEGK
jgi:Chaperone of endosialidase